MRERLLGLASVFAIGAALVSCDDPLDPDDRNTVTTSVVVDPIEFLGALGCGAIEGGPRSYTAIVTNLDTGEEVGRSERVNCAVPLAFTNVESGDRYSATIEVFASGPDEVADDPQWTTSCGEDGDGAARAKTLQQVVIRGCDRIGGAGTGTTSISVDTTAATAGLGCVDDVEPGLVETVTVVPLTPEDSGLPQVTRSCGQAPLEYGGGFVEPGVTYTFRLEAEGPALDPAWATTCTATAREGFGVPATCGEPTNLGSMRFPILSLLEQASLTCGEDVSRAQIALTAGPATVDPRIVACDSDATVGGIASGSYVGTVELRSGADTVAAYACTGAVEPASESELICTLED